MLKYENNTITRCQFGRRKSPPILAEKSLAKLEILQLVFFLTRAVKPFKITLTACLDLFPFNHNVYLKGYC